MALWFAFKNDGHVYELDGLAEKQLVASFAHGYKTMAEAIAHKNEEANPFQALMLAQYVTAAASPAGGGSAGVIKVVEVNAAGKPTDTVGPLSNPLINLGGTGSVVGDISHWLGQQQIWVRGVEIIAGLMLLYLGMKASMSPRGTLTGAASQGGEHYRTGKRVGKKTAARTGTIYQGGKKLVKLAVVK